MACGPHAAQDGSECGPKGNTANLLKTFFFARQYSLVFVYLMCGPETPKGWTPWEEPEKRGGYRGSLDTNITVLRSLECIPKIRSHPGRKHTPNFDLERF